MFFAFSGSRAIPTAAPVLPASFVQYSVDPAWSPDSQPARGLLRTRHWHYFSVKAVTAKGAAHPLPALTLTRGARHLAFLPDGRALIYLRGEVQHKNL
jgi:hypothetical protein